MAKQSLVEHFRFHHENPPAPFNPDYDPRADERFSLVTRSMEVDNFYASHTREECKAEWRKRYDSLKQEGK